MQENRNINPEEAKKAIDKLIEQGDPTEVGIFISILRYMQTMGINKNQLVTSLSNSIDELENKENIRNINEKNVFINKESLDLIKYTVKSDLEELYDILLIPEDKNTTMGFYIQKQKYDIISHGVGIKMEDFKNILNVEEFIKANLNDWIRICEQDIKEI